MGCTPEDCTAMSSIFPGQVIDLAPEGSGFPSFYNVLGFEVVTIGLAEAYRTGLLESCFPELEVGDLHPGGEHFDPLGLGSETWPSYIDGAVGPYANWQAHIANPVYENVWKYIGLGSTAGLI